MQLIDAWTRLDNGLKAFEPVWRPQPFRLVTQSIATSNAWQHPLHERALELDEPTFQTLFNDGSNNNAMLYDWIQDVFVDLTNTSSTDSSGDDQNEGHSVAMVQLQYQAQLFGSMVDVLQELPTQQAGDIFQPPSYSGRTQPREANGVPGRKWEQVEAFSRLVPEGSNPIVDWCSGKGHLARWMHTSTCTCEIRGRPVHCLEIDQNLVRSGELLTKKQKSIPQNGGIEFYEHDVLTDPLPSNLEGTDYTHTALHACGELHRTALVAAATQQARAVVVVPCCYEKHFGVASNSDSDTIYHTFRPLSDVANKHTSLSITRDDLFLAVADGVVTASAKEAKVREKEMAWRLAFDLWRTDIQLKLGTSDDQMFSSTSEYPTVHVPSAPYRLLAEDDFALFLRHCVMSKGRSSAARKRLEPALNAALTNGSRVLLEDYAVRGEELRLRVERLELVRRAFQRPFEMWLATDYGLFLEEKGYQVDLRTLCDRSITPRNIAIVAQRL